METVKEKDVSEWICKTTCQDDTGVIKKDTVVYHTGPIIPCTTCKGTGEKDSKVCRKCSGTGRGVPSHHFNPYDAEAERLEREVEKKEDAERVEKLRAEITELGGAFDFRWGAEKLEAVLITAKKIKGDPKEPFVPFTDKAGATGKAIELGLNLDGRSSLKSINDAIKEKVESGE